MGKIHSDMYARFSSFWWGEQGLSTLLFIFFALFFLSPFIESHLAGAIISIFFVLLLISGIANVTSRISYRVAASMVALSALTFNVLHNVIPGKGIDVCWVSSALVFFFILSYVVLKEVFKDGPVTAHRVRGAIAVYLLIGITWSFIYQLIVLLIPNAISFPSSMTALPGTAEHQSALTYFSFVTMTTLGYGDIVPVSPVARMFVIVEALIGQLYPATLLARLVSLEIIYREKSLADSSSTSGNNQEEQ